MLRPLEQYNRLPIVPPESLLPHSHGRKRLQSTTQLNLSTKETKMSRRDVPKGVCASCRGSGVCDKCQGSLLIVHGYCRGVGEITCRLCKGAGAIERGPDGRWEPAVTTHNSGNYYPKGRERECFRCHGTKYEECQCNHGYVNCPWEHGEDGSSCGNCNGSGRYIPRHLRWWASRR